MLRCSRWVSAWWVWLPVLCVACETRPPAPLFHVFDDGFDSDETFGSYSAVGGATLSIAGGRLAIGMPSPIPTSGAGFRVDLPPPTDGVGVRCMRFSDFVIPESPVGTFMEWTWFGFDVDGNRVVVLETRIEKTGSFTVRHRKANGTLVTKTVEDKSWSDVKTKRWDTRRGGREVQLEIEFKDGSRYNSEWIDPDATFIAGFSLAATVDSFSIGFVEGSQFHWEPPKSQTLPAFSTPELNARSAQLIELGIDADLVVAATVARVGSGGLAVDYVVDALLKGQRPQAERIQVLHDAAGLERIEPEARLILYLRAGAEPSQFAVIGSPSGLLPFTTENLEAAFARL